MTESVLQLLRAAASEIGARLEWLKIALFQLGLGPATIVLLGALVVVLLLAVRKPYRIAGARRRRLVRAGSWLAIGMAAGFAVYTAGSEIVYRLPAEESPSMATPAAPPGIQSLPIKPAVPPRTQPAPTATFTLPAAARTVRASQVDTHAIDADTLRVGRTKIRLDGIAAPEQGHPAYLPGRRLVERLIARSSAVECVLTGKRSYDREIGFCVAIIDGDRVDIQAMVVLAGLARDCPRYSNFRYRTVETPAARRLPLPGYCRPRLWF